jgi:hypothetical protein
MNFSTEGRTNEKIPFRLNHLPKTLVGLCSSQTHVLELEGYNYSDPGLRSKPAIKTPLYKALLNSITNGVQVFTFSEQDQFSAYVRSAKYKSVFEKGQINEMQSEVEKYHKEIPEHKQHQNIVSINNLIINETTYSHLGSLVDIGRSYSIQYVISPGNPEETYYTMKKSCYSGPCPDENFSDKRAGAVAPAFKPGQVISNCILVDSENRNPKEAVLEKMKF